MHRKFYHEIDNSTVNPTGNQLKKKRTHTKNNTANKPREKAKKKQQTETENENEKIGRRVENV